MRTPDRSSTRNLTPLINLRVEYHTSARRLLPQRPPVPLKGRFGAAHDARLIQPAKGVPKPARSRDFKKRVACLRLASMLTRMGTVRREQRVTTPW